MLALSSLALVSCTTPAALAPMLVPAAQRCNYLNTYVDDRGRADGSGESDLESVRGVYLHLYREAAERIGLKIVSDRSDAWMELWVAASRNTRGRAHVEFYLTPTLKLEQHFFVALMADSAFPYRGRFGSVQHQEVPSDVHQTHLVESVDFAIRANWNNESQQVLALCDIEDTLVGEGWSSIDELQDELIREIKRARRNRDEATRRKRLSVDVE